MKHFHEDEYFYTENGEITFNKTTGVYTVWDECYANIVCTTVYPYVAEAALKVYCEVLDEEIKNAITKIS